MTKIPKQKTFVTRAGDKLQNVQIGRDPGVIEEMVANLLEMVGVNSVGQYTITDTIGHGDVMAADGQYLWTLPIVGRKGFQKAPD